MEIATFILRNVSATERLARAFAENIDERAIIALNGPLGVGKTRFVQELASALDIDDLVSSPTFTMLNEYHEGRLPLFHLDLYRLSEGVGGATVSMLDLELSEVLEGPHVVVIEWAELLEARPSASAGDGAGAGAGASEGAGEGASANFFAGLDYLRADFVYDASDEVLPDNNSASLYKKLEEILADDAPAPARRVSIQPFGPLSQAILRAVLTDVPELVDN